MIDTISLLGIGSDAALALSDIKDNNDDLFKTDMNFLSVYTNDDDYFEAIEDESNKIDAEMVQRAGTMLYQDFFDGADLALIFTDLTGSAACEAAVTAARAAKFKEAFTVCLYTVPFDTDPESNWRKKEGVGAEKELTQYADICIDVFPAELEEGEEFINIEAAQYVKITDMLVSMLCGRGILSADISDLRAMFAKAGIAGFIREKAQGSEKVKELIDTVTERLPEKTERAILSLTLSNDVIMADIDSVVNGIVEKLPEEAEIIFAADYGNDIAPDTLIASVIFCPAV